MKFYSTLFILFVFCSFVQSANPLRFHKDGSFRIVQFTDVHFQPNNPASDVAIQCIENVLDAEKPDMVIFTGDLIYAPPAEEGIKAVLAPVVKRKLPFAVAWGNHDDEQGTCRADLRKLVESYSLNLGFTQPDLPGESNYVLPILNADKTPGFYLYVFDSRAYAPIKELKSYDWISLDQVNWYVEQSKKHIQQSGDTIPALAFFHIPFPEFDQAASSQSTVLIGTRMEGVASPVLNTGLFAAMRQQGDVMGVFVGHDHDNDYCAYWKGILLGYGRYTGGNTVYNHLSNGARVIDLKQGARSFSTHIRLRTGEVIQSLVFPDSFLRP